MNKWAKDFKSTFGKDPGDAPNWIVELAVRYDILRKSGGMRTETEFRMAKLCRELDVEAVKKVSETWKFMVANEVAEARAAKRKLPTQDVPLVQKSKRPTAAATVLTLLAENPVRSDEQIISAVKAATFHDGFNQTQLAWYKAKYRRGQLKGMNGEPHVIAETKSVPIDKTMVSVSQNPRTNKTKITA